VPFPGLPPTEATKSKKGINADVNNLNKLKKMFLLSA
jgi:hypothetical protein